MNPKKLCPKCKKCKKRKGYNYCRLCTMIMKKAYTNIATEHLMKGGTIEEIKFTKTSH